MENFIFCAVRVGKLNQPKLEKNTEKKDRNSFQCKCYIWFIPYKLWQIDISGKPDIFLHYGLSM